MPDYFTIDEYREVTGDDGSPPKASDSDIDRAAEEVAARLEAWARTAWVHRTVTETRYLRSPIMLLGRGPVVSVGSFTSDSEDITGYVIDEGGRVTWLTESWVAGSPPIFAAEAPVVITYTYGYAAPGWEIKRPSIDATNTRIAKSEGRTRIPKNVTAYRTEGTSFDLSRDIGSRTRPWPWDPYASNDVRQFWEPRRRQTFVGIA